MSVETEPRIVRAHDVGGLPAYRRRKLAHLAARAMGLPLAPAAAPEESEGEAVEDAA